jgi:hypothetical protein
MVHGQKVSVQRNEIFLGARFGGQIPIKASTSYVEYSTFSAEHRGVELGYTRKLKNGNGISLEVYAYVSRYGYSGKLRDCSSVLDYEFPFTSEGSKKGLAAYDPLVLTANYRWNFPSGNRGEWRFAAGCGIIPFYSRSVSFNFDSSAVEWECQESLTAQIGYGEDIYPVLQASAAYHSFIFGRHGMEARASFLGSLFDYYTGYVALDLLEPSEQFTAWQRRFVAVSLGVRYDFAW